MGSRIATSENALWQAAQWALDHHGDGAAGWIADRIEALAAAGDADGAAAWSLVLGMLTELQRVGPANGQAVH